ncbi:MAG: hypothetical protein EA406_06505 [Rhodospirillales bacterium]|nr:MAG: hypothetical protein EA406_06505 [Rhodospirillales bacterium]
MVARVRPVQLRRACAAGVAATHPGTGGMVTTDADDILEIVAIDGVTILPPDRERRPAHPVLQLWRRQRRAGCLPSLDDLRRSGWTGLDDGMLEIELPTFGGEATVACAANGRVDDRDRRAPS